MEPVKPALTLFCLSCKRLVTSPHDAAHDTFEIDEDTFVNACVSLGCNSKRQQALREALKKDRGAAEGTEPDLEELRSTIKAKKERLVATSNALNTSEKDVKSYEDTSAQRESLAALKEKDLKMDPANSVIKGRNEMEEAAANLNTYCVGESLVVNKLVQMAQISLAKREKLNAESKIKMSAELDELEQKIAEKKIMLESLVDSLTKGDAIRTASNKMQEALKEVIEKTGTECASKVKAMDVDFKATANKETASIMGELRRIEQTLLARKDNPAPIPQPDDSKLWKLERANKELEKTNEGIARENEALKKERISCDELRAENGRLNKEVATQKQELNREISGQYRENNEQKATIKGLQSEIANLRNNQYPPNVGLEAHARELAEKNKDLLQDNTWLNSKIARLEDEIKSGPQTASVGVPVNFIALKQPSSVPQGNHGISVLHKQTVSTLAGEVTSTLAPKVSPSPAPKMYTTEPYPENEDSKKYVASKPTWAVKIYGKPCTYFP